jgi:hypothetical protein
MSESGNFVATLITGGLGAAIGSVGTALIQTVSKKGEARATAADLVSSAAGNLADRLDKLNTKLEVENIQMRKALISLCEAVEDMLDSVGEPEIKTKVQSAINEARIAFR